MLPLCTSGLQLDPSWTDLCCWQCTVSDRALSLLAPSVAVAKNTVAWHVEAGSVKVSCKVTGEIAGLFVL